jgi:hypothetical protein
MKTLLVLVSLAVGPSSALACEGFNGPDGMRVTFDAARVTPTVKTSEGAVTRYESSGNGTEVRARSAFPAVMDPAYMVQGVYVGPQIDPIFFWVENAEDADQTNDVLVWGDQRLIAACD